MKPEQKTKWFVGGSVLLIVLLLLLVLFIDVLFPVRQEDVSISGPSLGAQPNAGNLALNITAPVVIVEFSDFQCPFCKQILPTLKRVKAVYNDKVVFVYKHFPLASAHPLAIRTAEAAECAGDQGMFWQYHDLLFENQNAFQDNQLSSYAEQLGLDKDVFTRCLASGIKRTVIQRDFQEGMDQGLQGTPTFFINGKRLEGAQPYGSFKEIIDEELAAYENKKNENR